MSRRQAGLALVLVAVAAFGAVGLDGTPWVPLLASTLRTTLQLATPLTLGALAALSCERAGVVNIGVEGMMLLSAFFGFTAAAAVARCRPEAAPGVALACGVAAAVLSGGAIGLAHAFLSVRRRMDPLISGIAINVLAVGTTGLLYGRWDVGAAASAGLLPSLPAPFLADLPVVGAVFVQQPIAWTSLLLVGLVHLAFFRTPWGLRARACGEDPAAARASGIDVVRMRSLCVAAGGLLAGLAGAYFTLEAIPCFEPLMTNGRGFMALAAMIFGGWNPFGALAVSLAFGAAQAVQVQVQAQGLAVPSQLVGMGPYLLTMVALAAARGGSPPEGLGKQPDAGGERAKGA